MNMDYTSTCRSNCIRDWFLGAGVILRRGNDSIAGLTTAAMIWGASGIGIAVELDSISKRFSECVSL